MSDDTYVHESHRIIHRDEWGICVRDHEEGDIVIAYQELDSKRGDYFDHSDSIIIPLDMLNDFAKIIDRFRQREADRNSE